MSSGSTPRGERHIELADQIVVAGGAMETPRLLLLSGLSSAQIGRNVMFHLQTFVFGIMPFRVHGHMGRSVTHVHDDHILVDEAARAAAAEAGLPWIKGGMVEHCSPSHPIVEAKHVPMGTAAQDHDAGVARCGTTCWGSACRARTCPSSPTASTSTRPSRDVRGLPVARTTYQPHAHELVASRHHGAKLAADHEGDWRGADHDGNVAEDHR